jgi:carbamoyl-phosphate synthase large subunit
MEEIGLAVPKSGYAGSVEEAREIVAELGYPVIVRPSFTLGGEGGGVAYNRDELEEVVERALQAARWAACCSSSRCSAGRSSSSR